MIKLGIFVKSQELDKKKQNNLIDQFNTSLGYAALVSEIEKHHKELKVTETETFSLKFANKEEGQEEVQVEALFVKLNDEVIIQALKQEGKELVIKAHYSAINEAGEKVIRKSIFKEDKVVTEAEIKFTAAYFLFVEELKNPQAADEVAEGEIAPEAWYDGCLSFYNSGNGKTYNYKWCGKGCGSGTPINPLDTCCRTHDRCYANFGRGDNGCDWDLYYCANAQDDPGWWMVAEYGRIAAGGGA